MGAASTGDPCRAHKRHEKRLGALVQVQPPRDGASGLAIRPWRLKRGSSASRVSEARAFPCDQFSLEGKAPPNPTGVYNPRHCKTAGETAQNPANCTTVCQKAGKFPATGAVLRFGRIVNPCGATTVCGLCGRNIRLVRLQACQSPSREREKERVPSHFHRPRRRAGRGGFCVGKSHFPEQKSVPCSFRARKSAEF